MGKLFAFAFALSCVPAVFGQVVRAVPKAGPVSGNISMGAPTAGVGSLAPAPGLAPAGSLAAVPGLPSAGVITPEVERMGMQLAPMFEAASAKGGASLESASQNGADINAVLTRERGIGSRAGLAPVVEASVEAPAGYAGTGRGLPAPSEAGRVEASPEAPVPAAPDGVAGGARGVLRQLGGAALIAGLVAAVIALNVFVFYQIYAPILTAPVDPTGVDAVSEFFR